MARTTTMPTSNSADHCLQAIARGFSCPRLPQPPPVDQILQHSPAAPAPRTGPFPWHLLCDHSTMTVIYREDFRCSLCGRESPLGWLYRCVADRDPLILEARDKGKPVVFDDIGGQFADQMSLGKFGPDRRTGEDSILDEMSPEQLCSCTPEQLDILLSQRENVRKVAAEARAAFSSHSDSSAERGYAHNDRPWIPNRQDECQFKICHACYKVGREKSWVSLNAVLNGDIMPTVATGFSFRYMGSRPVLDAAVLKNIGRRTSEPPQKRPTRPPLRRQAAQTTLCVASASATKASSGSGTPAPDPQPQNRPTRSPLQRQAAQTTLCIASTRTRASIASASASGTPAPDPQHAVSEGSTPPAAPGDSSATNGANSVAATPRSVSSAAFVEVSVDEFIFDYGCSEYTLACCTPLPKAGLEEERALAEAEEAVVEGKTAVVGSTACSMLAGLN